MKVKSHLFYVWFAVFFFACHSEKESPINAFFPALEAKLEPCQISKFKAMDLSLILNSRIFYDEISDLYLDTIYHNDFNMLFDSLKLSNSLGGKVSFIRSIFYYKLNRREIDYERILNDFEHLQDGDGYFLSAKTYTEHLLIARLLKFPNCKVGDTLDLVLPSNGDGKLLFSRDSVSFLERKVIFTKYDELTPEKCDLEKVFYKIYSLQFLDLDKGILVRRKIYHTGDTISLKIAFDKIY